MKTKQKKKQIWGPIKVLENLEMARHYLQRAMIEDQDLAKFVASSESGRYLSLGDMHDWLSAAIEHYEKSGPKYQALKDLEDLQRSQTKFAMQ